MLLPGQHLTNEQIRGTITGKQIMEGSRIKTTLAAADRYNACRFRLETCSQSEFNGAIQIPDVISQTLVNRDGQTIVEELLQPAAFVNSYIQAQQIARTRTRLYAQPPTHTDRGALYHRAQHMADSARDSGCF